MSDALSDLNKGTYYSGEPETTVICPLCGKPINHLNVIENGKVGHGFCPRCHGELSEKQAQKLNEDYIGKRRGQKSND